MSTSVDAPATSKSLISESGIERFIMIVRGQKVLLDSDLSQLYGIPTSRFNEQVRRNMERFPPDFMFQMNRHEFDNLISQFAISRRRWGGRRKLPLVFTEQGVAMLSSVLRSKRAVRVNIEIMRAFVQLRRLLNSHEELSRKLASLEAKYAEHDGKLAEVFEAIRQLMSPIVPKRKRHIGFRLEGEGKGKG